MQDHTSLEDQQGAAPRGRGLLRLLLGLAFLAVAGLAWFGIFSGMLFALSWFKDGPGGFNAVVSNFQNFDVRDLATDAQAQRLLFAAGCLVYLSALASLLTLAHYFGGRDAHEMLGWRGGLPRMTRAAWILVAMAPVYHIGAGAILRWFFPDFATWLIAPRDLVALGLSFLMIVVLAPLVEELFFRGWLYGSLRAMFAARTTILATAALFAIVHWDRTGLYPVAVLVPGFVLSLIRERTGSSKAAALAHAYYNFVGWALLIIAGLFLRP